MLRHTKTSILFAACTVMLLLASCAKQKRQLFDTIPADAQVIVQANLDRLLKLSGCNSTGGSISLTHNLENLASSIDFIDDELLSAVASCGNIIDLESVMGYKCLNTAFVITAPVRIDIDDISLPESLKTRIPTLGRVHAYQVNDGVTLLATQSQAWIAHCDAEKMPSLIDSIVATADKEPLSMYLRVASYFDRSSHLKAYFALPMVDNRLGDDFNCLLLAAEVNDRTITASASLGLNGVAVNPIKSLTLLNPFVLELMPPRTAALAAIGLPPAITERITVWTALLPLKQRIAVEALSSMLDTNGGTLAIAAAPGGNAETIRKFSLNSWLLKGIAPMGENAESAVDLLESFLNDEAYCQRDSDYVAVTNYDPIDFPIGDDMWTSAAADAQAYMTILVPYQSQLMKALKLKNGYSLEVICKGAATTATLRMMGSSQYILPTLIADACTISQVCHEYCRN